MEEAGRSRLVRELECRGFNSSPPSESSSVSIDSSSDNVAKELADNCCDPRFRNGATGCVGLVEGGDGGVSSGGSDRCGGDAVSGGGGGGGGGGGVASERSDASMIGTL